MIIGIDASRVKSLEPTGTEAYSYYLIKYLAKIDKRNRYVLYTPRPIPFFNNLPGNFKIKIIPFPKFWTQLRLSWEMFLNQDKIDVLLIPAHTVPIFHHRNTVLAVHGLEYEYFPESYSKKELKEMKVTVKKSCNWAKKIIVISKTTKDDLVKFYQIPEDKIEVIYLGIESGAFKGLKESKEEKILSKYSLKSKQYLFFIGRLEKRKNLKRVIEVFAKLKKEEGLDSSLRLVLAGKSGFGVEEIYAAIKSFSLEGEVILPGYISDIERNVLFKNALAFVFVSLAEGFGLPLLEAMKARVPIITSNSSALREIAGEAGLLVNPESKEDLESALGRIILDEKLRSELVERGDRRVEEFSWEKCAKKTLSLLVRSVS